MYPINYSSFPPLSQVKSGGEAFIQSAAVHKTIDLAVHRNVG